MGKAWKQALLVKFIDLGSAVTLVEFMNKQDKDSVIRDGPWSFDKHLYSQKRWKVIYKSNNYNSPQHNSG